MDKAWIALVAVLLALGGCATGPGTSSAKKPQKVSWNEGASGSAMGEPAAASTGVPAPRSG